MDEALAETGLLAAEFDFMDLDGCDIPSDLDNLGLDGDVQPIQSRSASSSRASVSASRKCSSSGIVIFNSTYDRFVSKYPRYNWGLPTFQVCSRIPVGDILKVWHGKPLFRKGSNHSFDLELWKPFIKYLNMLYWTDDETDTGTLSFLEMVVDFELYSGFRVQDPRAGIYTTWARKAAITSTLWQCALKYSIGELSKSNIKNCQIPSPSALRGGGPSYGHQ